MASVGYATSVTDHVEAILNGLPTDCDTFIVSVNSRTETYTVEEIESLLLVQKARIELHTKELDSSSRSFSLATHAYDSRRQNKGGGFQYSFLKSSAK